MSHDKKLDQAAKAAWLSYVAGLTQDEIAQHMGVSRQTAQRLVAQALSAGIVRVRIDHPLARGLELGHRLRDRFGLKICEVTPTEAGLPGIGMAVAALIERELNRAEPLTMALGTGRTLQAGIDQLSRIDCPQHKIVSLTGNIARDGSTAHYNVLFSMSVFVTARCFPLTVPVIAATAEECAALQRQPGNARVIEMARHADIALVGIGSLGPDAPLLKDRFLDEAGIAALVASGGVGEIVGRAYDRNGSYLPSDGRVASAQLPTHPGALIVGASFGPSKYEAIAAALRGRMLGGLITDEDTAEWLLGSKAG